MADYSHPLFVISQELENGAFLGEPLLFPEVSRLEADRARLEAKLRDEVHEVVKGLQPLLLHQRHWVTRPDLEEVQLTLEPPHGSAAWREPLDLKFDVIRWRHGEDAEIAYVPALGIEVVARPGLDLGDLVRTHIRFALSRLGAIHLGREIVLLQRCRQLHIGETSVQTVLPSPKQRAAAQLKPDSKERSALDELTTLLSSRDMPPAYEADAIVERIAGHLKGHPPQSVLLHGRPGTGKTACLLELVRSRERHGLGLVDFFQTSGSRLVAGQSGYGMWQNRCLELCRELSKRPAVLLLGNLVELIDVGKSELNDQGIASFLKPYIARGEILAIAESSPEQLPLLERLDPQLLGAFQRVEVPEPEPGAARAILRRAGEDEARKVAVSFAPGSLERLEQLHRRYATYSAFPGRPLRFLKSLVRDSDRGSTIAPEAVTRAFSKETGLPLLMLEDSVRLDLEATRRWFEERLVGQPEAVRHVLEVLARVKARLTRPRKPIASFLFIGPTGVGKTEMAKVLAELLFSSRYRLIRFDMSEYADPVTATRLVGGPLGSEGLLTSKVREQPFSVVLLDELEKADPEVFDLLLQVLGEARLTDAAGRVADFSNAIVIMTSNLGAESYHDRQPGFALPGDSRRRAREHFTEEVRSQLRPELFNRIDGIVCFEPLDQESVLRIARREIEAIHGRDGVLLRNVTLEVPEEAVQHLARAGFDPLYGARPLKRAIERELLAPLADGLNQYSDDLPLEARVEVDAGSLRLDVRSRASRPGQRDSELRALQETAALARRCMELRRVVQHVQGQPAVLRLESEIHRLRELEALVGAGRMPREALGDRPSSDVLARALEGLESVASEVCRLEDGLLLPLFAGRAADCADASAKLRELGAAWDRWLVDFHVLHHKDPDRLTIAVFSEDPESLFQLAEGYRAAVPAGAVREAVAFLPASRAPPPTRRITAGKVSFDLPMEVHEEVRKLLARSRMIPAVKVLRKATNWSLRESRDAVSHSENFKPRGAVEAERIPDPAAYLRSPRKGVLGIGLAVVAPKAALRFGPELGLHVVRARGKDHKCLVDTSELPLRDYSPPEGVERRGTLNKLKGHRRSYDFDERRLDDPELKLKIDWPGGTLPGALRELAERRLVRDALALVGLEP